MRAWEKRPWKSHSESLRGPWQGHRGHREGLSRGQQAEETLISSSSRGKDSIIGREKVFSYTALLDIKGVEKYLLFLNSGGSWVLFGPESMGERRVFNVLVLGLGG